MAGSADAQTRPARPAAPVAAPAAGEAWRLEGFRGARFGMTEAQVKAAAVKDFGVTEASIQSISNVAERTTGLVVKLDKLDPGPSPAIVTYIFGATSKTLVHINVVWSFETPTDQQRGQIAQAGLQLATYFRSLPQKPNKVGDGVAGPNALILYVATDVAGAGVEVTASGISFQSNQDGKQVASPTPTGAAVLRVAYSANATTPDVFQIKPGSF